MIPDNITREHIIKAMEEIDANGVPADRLPTKFYVIHNSRYYPPKYTISLANRFASGQELDPGTFSGGDETNPFLRERGFETLLIDEALVNYWLGVASEENWEKAAKPGIWGVDDNRSSTLKEIKFGDKLLVYLKGMKLAGIYTVNRTYYYDKSKIWDEAAYPHRMWFAPVKVPPTSVDITDLYERELKPKKGEQRGYFGQGIRRLPKEEFELFERAIMDSMNRGPPVFLTGYPKYNLDISARTKILGWKEKPTRLSEGSYVFVYDTTNKKIDSCFRLGSKSDNREPIWQSELESKKIHYPYRWNAEPIATNISIDLPTINNVEPFAGVSTGRKARFGLLIAGDSPASIDKPVYAPFREFLMSKLENSQANGKYLLLRSQPDSIWNDKEGEEYHFGTNVPRYALLTPGVHVTFDRNVGGRIEYFGCAVIEKIVEEDRKRTTPEGRPIIDKTAKLKDFVKFTSPVIKDDEITKLLETLPGYNNQHSIRPITPEIHTTIVNQVYLSNLGWNFDIEKVIDEVLEVDTSRELATERDIVRRIILHLKAGKHVMLVGPPGVGKTDLARRILRVLGMRVLGKEEFLEAVASDEWSRHEVIGGISLQNKFEQGCVTKAALDNTWLLIDEFNRADMNKAFGDMFLAIEYRKITLRPPESEIFGKKVVILPEGFRMICTMNDFDKNLLLTELSYGLISRFAFISITSNTNREPIVVERRVKAALGDEIDYGKYMNQIEKYFKFINEVRRRRNIGVRTSIDVIKYLITASTNEPDSAKYWIHLSHALSDYVLPQFDRLDKEIIEGVLEAANQHLDHTSFEDFKNELRDSRDRLKRVMGWLLKKDV